MIRRLTPYMGILVAGLAIADDTGPRVAALPFSHPIHEDVFQRKDVTCVTCHPVGLTGVERLPPMRSSCHACHLREVDGAPRRADRTCGTCHDDRQSLIPDTHDVAWLATHGAHARGLRAHCSDCHDAAQCVDCHDGRGALSTTPHPPGFQATHGLDARLDPGKCGTCHVGDTCTACHIDGRPIQ